MSKRKQITADFNEIVKLEKVGDEFAGIYTGSRDVMVDGETRTIHGFKRSGDNVEVDMWGAGQLNQIMKKVKVGTPTWIKRTEDVDSPTFKGSKMKTFQVEVE